MAMEMSDFGDDPTVDLKLDPDMELVDNKLNRFLNEVVKPSVDEKLADMVHARHTCPIRIQKEARRQHEAKLERLKHASIDDSDLPKVVHAGASGAGSAIVRPSHLTANDKPSRPISPAKFAALFEHCDSAQRQNNNDLADLQRFSRDVSSSLAQLQQAVGS